MDENCAANNTHFKSSHKRKVFVLDPLHLFKVTQTSLSSIVTLSINVIQGLKFRIHFQQKHPPLKYPQQKPYFEESFNQLSFSEKYFPGNTLRSI